MDAFEKSKYSEAAFFKLMLSNSVIVSYGTITAIDLDSVEVALSVSNKNFAEKINCTFMQLGNEQFSLSFRPEIGISISEIINGIFAEISPPNSSDLACSQLSARRPSFTVSALIPIAESARLT